MPDDLQTAKELGIAAFKAGRKAVPALDPGINEFIKGKGYKPGEMVSILSAWIRGWHQANIEEPIPEHIGFREWLLREGAMRPGAKSGLYPLGYGGIGLYPPQEFITSAADAIYYLSIDERLKLMTKEGPPHDITHLPGKPSHTASTEGEGPPWKIDHVPGKPSHQGKTTGEKSPWDISHIPK